MWQRPSHSVVVSVAMVVTVALGGCSSSGGGSETRREQPGRSAERTTTTAAPARIDLSKPIPGGSLHGTPRPPLENTGDDYVAIFESLLANFRWLTENPDVATLDGLFVPGTEAHTFQVEFFTELVGNGWRSADDGYYLVSAEIVDARPGAVSLRFSDAFDFERIVDANGAQVGEGRAREPSVKTWNALLASDSEGQWRFADVTPSEGGTVQL
jgi:hypothetical protein